LTCASGRELSRLKTRKARSYTVYGAGRATYQIAVNGDDPTESSKCPNCGDEPQFVEHISKWYCYGCNSYLEDEPVQPEVISEESKDEPKAVCGNCGAELQGLKDGKLFCFVCETYPDDSKSEPKINENEAQSLVDSVVEAPKERIEPTLEITPVPAPAPAQVPAPDANSVQPSPPTPEPAPVSVIPPTVPAPSSAPKNEAPSSHPKMCPSCGHAMKWIDKYQRNYCYGCRKYSPKDEQKLKGQVERKKCPGCSGDLRFIQKYNEWYCYKCKSYPLRVRKPSAPANPEKPACPKCSEPLKWIEKYQRHYCYSCKEYAPKGIGGNGHEDHADSKKCPTCSGDMKYVAEYDEWYCYSCRKYALRPSRPLLL